MHHPSLFQTLVALVVACLVALTSSLNAVAQDTDADAHPIVGTWQVFLGDDPHMHGLLTHAADGTMTSSDPVTMVAAPGVTLFLSGAHGVWEPTGPNTIAYTYQQFSSDADGTVAAIITISGVREVSADGGTFVGRGTYTITDPAGAVIDAGDTGEVRGERMVVVPVETVGTPVATPAS